MKLMLLCLLTMLGSFSAQAQHEKIEIQIKQGGNLVQPKNHVYHLKSEAFSFEVASQNIDGFLIGATMDDDLYRSALGDADLEVAWFDNTGVADDMFNPDKEIIVSNDVASYWFYTNSKEHRFDKTPKGNAKSWVASRTISNLNMLTDNTILPISKMKKSLYVYFYHPIYDEDYNLKDKKVLFYAELKFD